MEFMNRPEYDDEEIENNIVFCLDDCDNTDCARNKLIPKIESCDGFAFLKETKFCPLNTKF